VALIICVHARLQAVRSRRLLPPELGVRRWTNPCHIEHMAKGWKIVAVLPSKGGGAPLQEWVLVAIPDKGQAIKAVKSLHPHAAIRVDSEADADAKHDVKEGKIVLLKQGS
jgi:hypothetical protein